MDIVKVFKEFAGQVIKEIDEEARTLVITASTGERDRVNEEIPPSEWKLDNYNKNPVVLWAHTYDQPPVAKALWTKTDKGGLKQKLQFAKTDFATDIFNLYKDGFLNAFSVGFTAKRDEKDNNIFREAELLEVSCVPVPCNASALAERSLANINIKSNEAKELIKKIFIFIHIRVRPPEDFNQESFRTIEIGKDKGIKAVVGKLTGETSTTVQKYIFEKAKGWTMETATQWVKEHGKDFKEPEATSKAAETMVDLEIKIIGLEKEIEVLKEGRVLSAKNRELIGKCVVALQELMDATEPAKSIDNENKCVIIKTKDEPKAESLAEIIRGAVKAANVPELVRSELKRLKGEVE